MHRWCLSVVVIAFVLLLLTCGSSYAAGMSGVVDELLGKYQHAGQAWVITLRNGATNVFWALALISLSWTFISMGIKQADLVEIVVELCRFIMFTGFFFWLLMNGPDFAGKIMDSLRQLGGDATGTGKSIYPGDLIELGMQIYQNVLRHTNWLLPELTAVPAFIAVLILIVCTLIAVNMILLLCAAWVVLYAGIIFLGFGGCRWTSDMAINYYRTVLGVGVSLMTMELIIGIGIQFLKDLVQQSGDNPDIGQLGVLMCAAIILAVIAHRLPHMVAGMVVGGGNNGAIGGIGMMTLFAAGMTGMGLASRLSGNPAAAVAAEGVGEGAKMLQDRLAAVEAAMGAQGTQGSMAADTSGSGSSATGESTAKAGGFDLRDLYGRRSRAGSATSAGGTTAGAVGSGAAGSAAGGPQSGGGKTTPAEPPLERPMSADEARGFGPDGNGGVEGQPYTPTSEDQST